MPLDPQTRPRYDYDGENGDGGGGEGEEGEGGGSIEVDSEEDGPSNAAGMASFNDGSAVRAAATAFANNRNGNVEEPGRQRRGSGASGYSSSTVVGDVLKQKQNDVVQYVKNKVGKMEAALTTGKTILKSRVTSLDLKKAVSHTFNNSTLRGRIVRRTYWYDVYIEGLPAVNVSPKPWIRGHAKRVGFISLPVPPITSFMPRLAPVDPFCT